MHKPVDNVLGLFGPPGREDSLRAVARALLRIRSNGVTCETIAMALDCSADTIENASNEKSLLGFHSIARLGFHFPEEFALIEALWTCRAAEPLTPLDRLERIERETSAIRREIGA